MRENQEQISNVLHTTAALEAREEEVKYLEKKQKEIEKLAREKKRLEREKWREIAEIWRQIESVKMSAWRGGATPTGEERGGDLQ